MGLPYPAPLNTVPTVVFGYVAGPLVRLEDKSGRIGFWNYIHWLVWRRPVLGFAVTHLQKYSKFGFLLTWPFCFHIYYQFKKQAGNDAAGWIPGSERVFYARTPGYRKDTDYGMKWTWGYIGGHWD
jgi:hypothetical protein